MKPCSGLVPVLLAAIAMGIGIPTSSVRAAAANAGKQTKEKEPTIEGLEIARPNGKFLGLQLVSGSWVMTFYDENKKPEPVDVTRAILSWPVNYKPTNERVVLNPGAPNTLANGFIVRPPHNMRVSILLFQDDSETAAERYTVTYNEAEIEAKDQAAAAAK